MKKPIILETRIVVLLAATIAIMIAIAACKKTPTTPAPVAQSITMSSTSDMYYIGNSETFSATVTMSDGTTKAVVGGTWSTDTPSVATVNSSGLVTIVGSGNVTVIVQYQGLQGSKLIRGLPNYQGTWSGSYYIVSCSGSGYFKNECASFPVNQVFPTNLNLIQDRDRVTGKFYLGTLSADASGPVQMDGVLLLTGKILYDIFTLDVSWRMQSATPGKITGSMSWLWLAAGRSGDMRISCNIRDLNRTSTVGMSMGPGALRVSNPTIQSIIRAMIEP